MRLAATLTFFDSAFRQDGTAYAHQYRSREGGGFFSFLPPFFFFLSVYFFIPISFLFIYFYFLIFLIDLFSCELCVCLSSLLGSNNLNPSVQ